MSQIYAGVDWVNRSLTVKCACFRFSSLEFQRLSYHSTDNDIKTGAPGSLGEKMHVCVC